MVPAHLASLLSACAVVIAATPAARAEMWPPLADYVASATLIVEARATGRRGGEITFEVVDTLVGTYRPERMENRDGARGFIATAGQHGLDNVALGSRVFFIFTSHNQPRLPKLSSHSTAFVVRNDKVVYGATTMECGAGGASRGCRQEFLAVDFAAEIRRLASRTGGCRAVLEKKGRELARALRPFLLDRTAPKRCLPSIRPELRRVMATLGRDAASEIAGVLAGVRPTDRIDPAVLILFDIGPPASGAVDALIKLLPASATNKRWSTYYLIAALGAIGERRATRAVRPFLGSPDNQVAREAATALAAFGDRASFGAVARLIPAAGDSWSDVADLLRALQHLDPGRARPHIERTLRRAVFASHRGVMRSEIARRPYPR